MIAPSPSNLIELGAISEAQGLRGLVKVKPHSSDPVALLSSKLIWLSLIPSGGKGNPAHVKQASLTQYKVMSAKMHSGNVLMALEGIADRDQALALKGSAVYVSRADFPEQDENSFYWIDLIGLPVVNEQGQLLGEVADPYGFPFPREAEDNDEETERNHDKNGDNFDQREPEFKFTKNFGCE